MKFNDWYDHKRSQHALAELVSIYGESTIEKVLQKMRSLNNATFVDEDDDDAEKFFLSQIDRTAQAQLFGMIEELFEKKELIAKRISQIESLPAHTQEISELRSASSSLIKEVDDIMKKAEPIFNGTVYEENIKKIKEGGSVDKVDIGEAIKNLIGRIEETISKIDVLLENTTEVGERSAPSKEVEDNPAPNPAPSDLSEPAQSAPLSATDRPAQTNPFPEEPDPTFSYDETNFMPEDEGAYFDMLAREVEESIDPSEVNAMFNEPPQPSPKSIPKAAAQNRASARPKL